MKASKNRTDSAYARRLLASVSQTTLVERDELLAFRAEMYGPRSAFGDPAWVQWLYDAAPSARRTGPALWTYRHEGRIEAHQGAIFARVCVGGVERTLAWTLDLMVSPDHRARGIGAVLPEVPLGAVDAAAGTEVSDEAQKAFGRAGWDHHGTLPLWLLVVNPEPFLTERAGPLLARVTGSGARALFALGRVATRAYAAGRRLEPIREFDERADAIWEQCGAAWPVIVRRDRSWLTWRWDACPLRKGAFGVWLHRGAQAIGWAVLRIGEHRERRAGFILDLLCPREELRALLALCVAELTKAPIDGIYFLFRAPRSGAILRSLGFIRRDSGFAMMTHAKDLPMEERTLFSDPGCWFVTSGDSDLDRPRENTVFA